MIALTAIYSLSSLYSKKLYNEKFYNGKPINYLPHILESVVSKKVMLMIYYDLLTDKWVELIEDLPEETMELYRKEVEESGGIFSKNAARILHTIKFINENS